MSRSRTTAALALLGFSFLAVRAREAAAGRPVLTKPQSREVIAAPPPGGGSGAPVTRKGGASIRDRLSGPRTKLPTEAVTTLVRELRVVPSANNVVVTFKGPPNTVPFLEIGRTPPGLGADGRWAFPAGQGATAYPVGGDKEQGEFKIDIGFLTELQPNTQYYYLLNLRSHDTDPGARRQQVQGKFTTVSRTVRVVLTDIKVENDSDPIGNGELLFVLWVNGGEPGGARRVLGNDKRLDWGEGWHSTSLAMEIPNAPDQLTIQVDGFDDDTPFNTFSLPDRPLTGPGASSAAEWNLARVQFDLSRYPSGTVHLPFFLYSMGNGEVPKRYFIVIPEPGNFTESGGALGDLTFLASGGIDITSSAEPSPTAKSSPTPSPTPAAARQPRAVPKKPVLPYIRR